MKFLSNIRLLLIALWLGSAVFFSFSVAPTAFGVLKSREVAHASEHAGAIVSQSLTIINLSGLIIGLILLGTTFLAQIRNSNRVMLWTERILLLILTVSCAVGQFVIGLWITFVKAQIGKPIDEVAADDPLRIQFNNLHEYSVWVLIAAMIAALLAFFIISGKDFDNLKKTTSKDLDFQNDFKI